MPVSTVSTVSVLTNQQERDQINADASLTPATVATDRNDQRIAPVAQTAVALQGPPATLTASADTTLTWATTSGEAYSVRRVFVQNKSGNNGVTAVPMYVAFDATASAGSVRIDAGAWLSFDVPNNALHVYCTSALAVNGSSDGNVVVLGWL